MYRYLVIWAAKYFRPGELCRTSQAIEYYLKLIISVCALKIKYAIIPQKSVADPDPHYFRKPELKADSRSALVSNIKSFEGSNRAGEGCGRSQWRPGGSKWSSRGTSGRVDFIMLAACT
jgi:hypothetical protein